MSAAVEHAGEGSGFRAFLLHRGQDALRFGYLLTGDQELARALMLPSLAELGARWLPLIREYGTPEAALWVLATAHYLRDPPLGPAEPAADLDQPADDPAEHPDGFGLGGLGRDEDAIGWRSLRDRSPAERADLLLRYWAELDVESLQEALRPPRRSLTSALRSRLRDSLQRIRARAEQRGIGQDDADRPGKRTLVDAPAHAPRPTHDPGLAGWTLQRVFQLAERQAPGLEPEFITAVEARTAVVGQRQRRHTRLVAAGVSAAVVATIGLAAIQGGPGRSPASEADGVAGSAPISWSDAWPAIAITEFTARLRDGRPYTPLLFVDTRTAVAAIRINFEDAELLLVDVIARTARTLGQISAPIEQVQTATDGAHVGWLTHTGGDRSAASELWVADVSGGPSRRLASVSAARAWGDQGLTLGLGAGRLYLVRTFGLDVPTTQVSSVRLAGGELEPELSLPGYIPVGWPWLSTIGTPTIRRVTVRNVLLNETRDGRLPAGSSFGACGGVWCVGSNPNERAGESLFSQLDGTRWTKATLADLAVEPQLPIIAGRFVLTGGGSGDTRLHDLRENRAVQIEGRVRQVVPSGRLLGWRVTEGRSARWRVADLVPVS